jgi:hypothetical protein
MAYFAPLCVRPCMLHTINHKMNCTATVPANISQTQDCWLVSFFIHGTT